MSNRRLLIVIICVFLLTTSIFPERVLAANKLSGYKSAAKSKKLELYYNSEDYSIIIEDRDTGTMWSSCVTKKDYDIDDLNPLWKAKLNTLFDFKYAVTTKNQTPIVSIDYTNYESDITLKEIENGVEVTYDYESLGIKITLEITLWEDFLEVRIPMEKLEENDRNRLVSIELMPSLGIAKPTDEGYVLYPDGSGAIHRFKGITPKAVNKASWEIYSPSDIDIEKLKEKEESNIYATMLPVFGIKRGDSALFGLITEGDFDAAINFAPSGHGSVKLNRIYPEFIYRRTYRDPRSDPKHPPKVETNMIEGDRVVRYYFLTGDRANYSGMASVYRDYLLEDRGIVSKIEDKESLPLCLDLFMGIREERLLYDRYVEVTSFDQAKLILNEFLDREVKDIELNLVGWTKEGYGRNPAIYPPAREIGGKRGLREFADYTKDRDITLYLQANFIDAIKDVGGFSIRGETVYQMNNLVLTHGGQFILGAIPAYRRYIDKFIPKIEDYNVSGINFERMGEFLYFDYNKKNKASRGDTAEQFNKFTKTSQEKFGKAAVQGGNGYILDHVDRIYDIPVRDSEYIVTDEAVPFYQMVIHGIIPYTSSPGNLFYNYDAQKLKWIEYGCLPYYKLTYERSNALKYTDYNHLFSSYYEDWIDIACNTYEEFQQRLGDTWAEFMVGHEKIKEDVYKVTYADGTKIYINYRERSVNVDGYSVNPVDYLVIDGRGNIR